MEKDIIYIIALVFFCLGSIAIFLQKDIFKNNDGEKTWISFSAFVVSILSLAIIYYINR